MAGEDLSAEFFSGKNERLEKYLSLLNPEQLEAVKHEGSPLLILAGAGSGKTRVITTKIAWLISEKQYNPSSILAVTFTKKAAKEMQERAVSIDERASASVIRTFHSFGAWFLRRYAEEARIDPKFTVYDDDDMVTLVQKAFPEMKKQDASGYAHKISLAKDYCLKPDSEGLEKISTDAEFPLVYEAYEKRLRATGNVDFGDLIMLPVLVLQGNENVRRQMQYRFKVIMIDEYQDSNVAQFMLLKALSGVDENSGTYVCVVGDDDQSIYKFRGAEVQNILSFQKEFPGTRLVRLERNYRSTAKILHAADCVVSNNEDRLGKTLVAERGDGKMPDLVFLPTQDDEARFCAELIEKTHAKGVPYNDWAILYRTNAQSLGFETEFMHRKIPYSVVGSLKFYEREEIKDLLAYLSFIANQKDEIAFRRIVNKPSRGIGAASQDKVLLHAVNGETLNNLVEVSTEFGPNLPKKAREGLNVFCNLMKNLIEKISSGKEDSTLSEFVDDIMNLSGLMEYHRAEDEIAGTQRSANMQELSNAASLYNYSLDGLLEFLDHVELDRTLENEEVEYEDSVTLITLHNTKGLEFPRVVITGLETGIFPRGDKYGTDLEEERRLFYVGITRAKDELYITSCAQRRLYGRTEFMEPSLFLMEAGDDAFRTLGKVPSRYQYGVAGRSGSKDDEDAGDDDGDFSDNEYGSQGYAFGAKKINHPLAKKWSIGTNVYHDDYGYGQIVNAKVSDDEYVISVSFGSGSIKQFLPKYQSSSLLIVKE